MNKERQQQELEVFFPTEVKVQALDGTVVSMSSQIPWKKDIEVLRSVPLEPLFQLLSELPEDPSQRFGAVGKLAGKLLDQVPDLIISVVSKLIDKPKEWCETNLTIEHVLDIVVPFFARCYKVWRTQSQKFQPLKTGQSANSSPSSH